MCRAFEIAAGWGRCVLPIVAVCLVKTSQAVGLVASDSAAFAYVPAGGVVSEASAGLFFVPPGLAVAEADSAAFGYLTPGSVAAEGQSAAFGYLTPGSVAAEGQSAAFGYLSPGSVVASAASSGCVYYPAGTILDSCSSQPFAYGEDMPDMILQKAFDGIGEVARTDVGYAVYVTNDFTGTISLPDNLGRVDIDLGGHDLVGSDGADGSDLTAGGSGKAAIVIVASGETGNSTHLVFSDSRADATADIVGGNGGKGVPPGDGGPGVRVASDVQPGVVIEICEEVTLVGGKGGEHLAGGASGADGKPVDGGVATGEGEVIKAVVPVPMIVSAAFNGQHQVAAVSDTDRYSVTANIGGIDVGVYEVALTLSDPANCRWPDSDSETMVLQFVIQPRAGVIVTITGHSESFEFDGQTHTVGGWEFACDDALYSEAFVACSAEASVSAAAVGVYPMGLAPSAFSNLCGNFSEVSFKVIDGALTIEEAATPSSMLKYEKIGTDRARILGFASAGQQLEKLVFPSVIDGRTVTEIAVGAFANSTSGLKEVVLPKSCTVIGDKAFLAVKTLAKLTIPATASVYIGAYAFAGTSLATLFLPASVERVGDYAFANCQQLCSVMMLGRPELGKMPFRRAGTASGIDGVIVHLDPVLAEDAEYMKLVKQEVPSVKVLTDAIVTAIGSTSLVVEPNTVRLIMSVDRAAKWGAVDKDAVRVVYRPVLGAAAQILKPSAVTENADGSLTVEVRRPDGDCGFFQTTYGR